MMGWNKHESINEQLFNRTCAKNICPLSHYSDKLAVQILHPVLYYKKELTQLSELPVLYCWTEMPAKDSVNEQCHQFNVHTNMTHTSRHVTTHYVQYIQVSNNTCTCRS